MGISQRYCKPCGTFRAQYVTINFRDVPYCIVVPQSCNIALPSAVEYYNPNKPKKIERAKTRTNGEEDPCCEDLPCNENTRREDHLIRKDPRLKDPLCDENFDVRDPEGRSKFSKRRN